jgi:hypothetical protein
MFKSVEGLVDEINKTGWLITEIYQRDHDQWFAVLRKRGDFSAAYGEAATMLGALGTAWTEAQMHKRMTNADWDALKPKKVKVDEPIKQIAAEIKRRGSIPRIKP